MAPVKPMGIESKKPGDARVGFPQTYNETPSAQPTDLNPDVVTADSVLPAPKKVAAAPKAKRGKKR